MKVKKAKRSERKHVHLTSQDIETCRDELEDLIIAPYDSSRAKGTGYNLSLSEMIYSITRKRLLPICRESKEVYFWLHPNETVLALSYEYVKVSDNIAGTLHSRVRVTAQGIGNVSTTLDPGWNGMFLFSLNNPTRKKIKVVISSRIEGMMKPNPIITLIPWRIKDTKQGVKKEHPKLNVDNPPMRVDIWSELTSEPLRLFRNKQYQDFCRIVNKISEFQVKALENYEWTEIITDYLNELEIAIRIKNEQKIKESLTKIKNTPQQCEAVDDRLDLLAIVLDDDNIIESCSRSDYLLKIELAHREIQYQVLCGQVAQIHDTVKGMVPVSWRKNILANAWHFLLRNLGFVALTIISVILISYGKNINNSDYWSKLVLTLAPLAISIAYNMIQGIRNR